MEEINSKFLLVADEMHHLSSGTYSKGLLEKYDYRLGLSATPEIYNDEGKTDLLFNYFDGIVFTFDLDNFIVLFLYNRFIYLINKNINNKTLESS